MLFTASVAWVLMGAMNISWRWFAATCALPSLSCGLLCLFILPGTDHVIRPSYPASFQQFLVPVRTESPRYYFIKRNYSQAISVLDIISKTNSKGPCQLTVEDLLRDSEKASDSEGDDGYETYEEDDDGTSEKRLRLGGERVIVDAHYVPGDFGGEGATRGRDTLAYGRPRRIDRACGLGPLLDLFHPAIVRTTTLLVVVWWALNFGWFGLTLWLPTLFTKVGDGPAFPQWSVLMPFTGGLLAGRVSRHLPRGRGQPTGQHRRLAHHRPRGA